MSYTIILTETNGITVEQKEAGIAAALAAYNADNPETPLADNTAYVQFVMDHAAESYARSYAA